MQPSKGLRNIVLEGCSEKLPMLAGQGEGENPELDGDEYLERDGKSE